MEFVFSAELFPWSANTSWVFVSIPPDDADGVDDYVSNPGGFGSVRVSVQVGGTEWKTSLFPSKEMATYVLPVKKDVRKKEGIGVGDTVEFSIRVLSD